MNAHLLLRYFAFAHLPDHLQAISEPFHDLACELASKLDDGPMKDEALKKLLEAKDCAVRAGLRPCPKVNV